VLPELLHDSKFLPGKLDIHWIYVSYVGSTCQAIHESDSRKRAVVPLPSVEWPASRKVATDQVAYPISFRLTDYSPIGRILGKLYTLESCK
jgi:hypothetical protein